MAALMVDIFAAVIANVLFMPRDLVETRVVEFTIGRMYRSENMVSIVENDNTGNVSLHIYISYVSIFGSFKPNLKALKKSTC